MAAESTSGHLCGYCKKPAAAPRWFLFVHPSLGGYRVPLCKGCAHSIPFRSDDSLLLALPDAEAQGEDVGPETLDTLQRLKRVYVGGAVRLIGRNTLDTLLQHSRLSTFPVGLDLVAKK